MAALRHSEFYVGCIRNKTDSPYGLVLGAVRSQFALWAVGHQMYETSEQ